MRKTRRRKDEPERARITCWREHLETIFSNDQTYCDGRINTCANHALVASGVQGEADGLDNKLDPKKLDPKNRHRKRKKRKIRPHKNCTKPTKCLQVASKCRKRKTS